MKDKAAVLTAIGALLVFLVCVIVMYNKVEVEDPQWSRLVFIFSTVEAVAFAGVGYLWGREVNRPRAEKTEKMLTALANRVEAAATERQKDAQATDEEKKAWKGLSQLSADLK